MNYELHDYEIEKVSDYVMNLLPEEEKTDFEKKLKKNPTLQAEVALQRQVMALVENIEDTRLKNMLQEEQQLIDKEQVREEKTPTQLPVYTPNPTLKIHRKWCLAIAAIFALLFFYLMWQAFQPSSSEKIYATHFEPYINVAVSTVRASGSSIPSEVIKAFEHYEDGDYAAALAAFNQLNNQQLVPDYQFYKALTLMELGETIIAIPILQSLTKNSITLFQEHAHWYLALAYLKLNETDKTVAILKELLNRKPLVFKDKAIKLLEELQTLE